MDRHHGPDAAIATKVGIGLRDPHVADILSARPAPGWLEVHAENYMSGGPALERLLQVRRHYDMSLHGVGLSLGSAGGIDRDHLARLKALLRETEPLLVSEHLSWSISDGIYLNDLLPLPYTEETLDIVGRNIDEAQNYLGRRILIENPSRYLRFSHTTIAEPQFLAELVRRTGCGLLCDVNNIFVSAANFHEDTSGYLAALPARAIGEIHLAGHSVVTRHGHPLLIDDHGSPVCEAVWALYREAIGRFGPVPSLIEWDKNLPELPDLLTEMHRAESEAGAALDVGTHAVAS